MKPAYRLLRLLGHQRWIRFGIRDRIIRLFIKSDGAPSHPFSAPFYGLTYEGNLASFIDWSVYFYGAYSYQELDLIRDILRHQTDPVFIDVGANVGNHSLFASAYSRQVLAFEPVSALYKQLLHKQSTNQLTNLTAFNYALGEANSVRPFLLPTSCNQGIGRVLNDGETSQENTTTVPVKEGDTVLHEQRIPPVTLIKVDVEGYEPSVLRGLANTLLAHRPTVFFEWSRASASHLDNQPVGTLFPPNYRLYAFESHRPAFFFFEHKHYRLSPARAAMPAGNYVAIPTEALTQKHRAALHVVV